MRIVVCERTIVAKRKSVENVCMNYESLATKKTARKWKNDKKKEAKT